MLQSGRIVAMLNHVSATFSQSSAMRMVPGRWSDEVGRTAEAASCWSIL